MSNIAPSPWHSLHAPCGELNENKRGSSSAKLFAHDGQARRVEKIDKPAFAATALPPFAAFFVAGVFFTLTLSSSK